MQRKNIIAALQMMRDQSKTRRFVQSIELIINFKGLDPKNPANQIDVKVSMPHATGKKASGKSLLFARDKEFIESVKAQFDRVIEEAEIAKLGKKDVALIASEFDVLLAEGPVMIAVGKHLGQQLAPKGKMPKPVQSNAAIVGQVLKQAGSVTKVSNKKGKFMPVVQTIIGNEKMSDQELSENALAISEAVVKQLPRKQQNIKSIYVKETMGPPIKLGAMVKGAEKK